MSDLARTNGQLDPMTVAQVFRASGMFPDIHSEAAAAAKLIIGRGLGLTDYDAMSGLHIIKGKAVLAANLMAAAIKRAGKYDYRCVVNEDEARIEFRQRTADGGWETIGITSYTMDDAKRAGLGGDNWRKYPKAMLFARAISTGYKQHCPDALGAAPVYVEAHGETEIVDDAPPSAAPAPKALPAAPKALPAAPTREERRADMEALLDPTPKAARTKSAKQATSVPPGEIPIDGGTDAPRPAMTLSILLTYTGTKVAKITTPNGPVWRVDVAGDEKPYAILDQTLAESVEASLAFKVALEAEFSVSASGKRVIHRVSEVGHG